MKRAIQSAHVAPFQLQRATDTNENKRRSGIAISDAIRSPPVERVDCIGSIGPLARCFSEASAKLRMRARGPNGSMLSIDVRPWRRDGWLRAGQNFRMVVDGTAGRNDEGALGAARLDPKRIALWSTGRNPPGVAGASTRQTSCLASPRGSTVSISYQCQASFLWQLEASWRQSTSNT
jgi:hypothetical protein